MIDHGKRKTLWQSGTVFSQSFGLITLLMWESSVVTELDHWLKVAQMTSHKARRGKYLFAIHHHPLHKQEHLHELLSAFASCSMGKSWTATWSVSSQIPQMFLAHSEMAQVRKSCEKKLTVSGRTRPWRGRIDRDGVASRVHPLGADRYSSLVVVLFWSIYPLAKGSQNANHFLVPIFCDKARYLVS